MKKTLAILMAVLCAICLITSAVLGISALTRDSGNTVIMEVKDYGTITIELYPEKAPITVANFKKLVGEGFYDGLTFHRVMEGFMIQGGDPKGDGTGGSAQNIKGEFSINGVQNDIKHVRGTISMARQSYPYDSASSQFFIVHETSQNNSYSLDGKYAAFGQVTSGMEVVDAIAAVATNPSNNKPLKDVVMTSVRFAEEPGVPVAFIVFSGVAVALAVASVVLFLCDKNEKERAFRAAEAARAAKRAGKKK